LECGVCKVTENCTNNVCAIKPPVCVPNTDIALCQAAGYSCGSLVTIDNCGGQRNIPECSLGHILSCPPAVGALCIAHMCCMPLTDASLCASAAKVCGSLDVTDCEIPRHVVSCGVCVGAKVCQPNGTCL
jgi:hypothetical protein